MHWLKTFCLVFTLLLQCEANTANDHDVSVEHLPRFPGTKYWVMSKHGYSLTPKRRQNILVAGGRDSLRFSDNLEGHLDINELWKTRRRGQRENLSHSKKTNHMAALSRDTGGKLSEKQTKVFRVTDFDTLDKRPKFINDKTNRSNLKQIRKRNLILKTDKNDLCGHGNNTCHCFRICGGLKASCNCLRLQNIPSALNKTTKVLDVSCNNISMANFSNLRRYHQLEELNLSHNGITNIRNGYLNQLRVLVRSSSNSNNNKNKNNNNKIYMKRKKNYLKRMKTLFLGQNNLFEIGENSFHGFKGLQFLDLSYNKITWINKSAFEPLKNLTTLYLHQNSLNGIYESNESRQKHFRLVFQPLRALRTLWIQGNAREAEAKTYPNEALAHLPNLRELAVDGLPEEAVLGSGTTNTTGLHKLERLLIGYHGYCYITNITLSFFQHVQKLNTLMIFKCPIQKIDPSAFQVLRDIKNYSVIHPTEGYGIKAAFEDLTGFQNSSLEYLAFNGFVRGFNSCRVLTGHEAKYLKGLPLKTLCMNFNFISSVDADFLGNVPPTITSIQGRGNKFTFAESHWSKIMNFTSLKEIDMRDQNVMNHYVFSEKGTFSCNETCLPKNPPHKKRIYKQILTRSNVKSKSLTLDELNCLTRACYEHKPTQDTVHLISDQGETWMPANEQLSNASTCDPTKLICLPPNLRVLKASGFTNFGKELFTRPLSKNSLCLLDFSSGFFTDCGNGTLPKTVKILDLGNNLCNTLNQDFFQENNSLIYLNLENNHLGPLFGKPDGGAVFSHLENLRILNIGRNQIYELPYSFFRSLTNLKSLALHDNKLEILDVDLSSMPKLRYIDLRNNAISWIASEVRKQLNALATDHPVEVKLIQNSLPCTCDGIELLKWMLYSNVTFSGKEELGCLDKNKKDILIGDFRQRISSLEQECKGLSYNIQLLIYSISFSVFFLIIGITSCFLYKNRWKLIYIRNAWLVNWFGFHPMGKTASHRMYDVYVVYCEEDRDFALGPMIEELETKRRHKLCLEDRDFIPGTVNFSNIMCAVKNSTITLLLLSPDFLRRKEIEYATQMALMEEFNDQVKREVILLLCYREIRGEKMSKDLLMLMKRGRFLDYPQNDDAPGKELFWNRLSTKIGHTHNNENPEWLYAE